MGALVNFPCKLRLKSCFHLSAGFRCTHCTPWQRLWVKERVGKPAYVMQISYNIEYAAAISNANIYELTATAVHLLLISEVDRDTRLMLTCRLLSRADRRRCRCNLHIGNTGLELLFILMMMLVWWRHGDVMQCWGTALDERLATEVGQVERWNTWRRSRWRRWRLLGKAAKYTATAAFLYTYV